MLSILRCCKHFQTVSYGKIPSRNFMRVSEKMESLLKKSDQVPQNYRLIYRVPSYKLGALMYHSLNFMTCFSLSTIAYYQYNGWESVYESVGPGPKDLVDKPWKFGVYIFVSIALVTVAAIVRGRYAIRIYSNEKSKTCRAIFIGKAPFTSHFYDFPTEKATFVAKNSILPWRKTLIDANGKNIMIFDDNFRTPRDFNVLLKPGECE